MIVEWIKKQGLNAIPLQNKSKEPALPEWKPYQTAIYPIDSLKNHRGNLGIICGKISGELVVVDVDDKEIYKKYFAELEWVQKTAVVETYRGFHIYIKNKLTPIGKSVLKFEKNKKKVFGIDVLSNGCYITAPMSIHPEKGWIYRLINSNDILSIDFDIKQELSEVCDRILLDRPELNLSGLQSEEVDVEIILNGVQEGDRDLSAIKLATYYRINNKSELACFSLLKEWNLRNKPPLTELELEAKVKSAYKKETPYKYKFKENELIEPPTEEIVSFLKDPKIFDKITIEELNKKIAGEEKARRAIFLCACGAWVKNANIASYNLLVSSKAGAGKDYTTSATLSVLPTKLYIKKTRISPTAFTYWHNKKFEPNWSWDGKVFYTEDISTNVLNSEVFKVMCSSGSSATIVIKQRAYDIEIVGKPVVITTTANAEPSAELMRRFCIVTLDEGVEQTIAVMEKQALFAAMEGGIIKEDSIVPKALSQLKRISVKIPYAKEIPKHFPKDNVVIRTHFPRFLDYIKASVALHQFQRAIDENGNYTATGQDYELAREIAQRTATNPQLISLTHNQQKILNIMKERLGGCAITDLEEYVSFISDRQLRRELDFLADAGILLKFKEQRVESDRPVLIYKYDFKNVFYLCAFDKLLEMSNANDSDEDKKINTPQETMFHSQTMVNNSDKKIEGEIALDKMTYFSSLPSNSQPPHENIALGHVQMSNANEMQPAASDTPLTPQIALDMKKAFDMQRAEIIEILSFYPHGLTIHEITQQTGMEMGVLETMVNKSVENREIYPVDKDGRYKSVVLSVF